MIIDQNIRISSADAVKCRHCGETLGNRKDPLARALTLELPSTAAGPGIHVDPSRFTDRKILLRQVFCPGCRTLFSTEIVPAGEGTYRGWSLLEAP